MKNLYPTPQNINLFLGDLSIKKLWLRSLFIIMFLGFANSTVFSQTIIDNTASGSSGTIPSGWSGINNITANTISQTGTGGYYLVESKSSPDTYDYLISNQYSIIGDVIIEFNIATYGAGDSTTMRVDISTDGGSTWGGTQTSGSVSSTTYSSFSVNFNGINSSQVKFRFYDGDNSSPYVRLKNIVIKKNSPTITPTPSSLTALNYVVGSGPSTSQSFNLTGSNLAPSSGNITITPSTNFEVSTDNSNFTGTKTIAYSSGALSSTPIYVRLKTGLPINTYSENITIGGGGVTTFNYSVSGSVLRKTITSNQNGDWNDVNTWVGGAVPGSGDNVVINHNIWTSGDITRDNGTTTTLAAGKYLYLKNVLTNNGTTTINGLLQMESGSWATGNSFVYGSGTGTLVFNKTSSGTYGVSGDAYWPSTNGPVNVTVIGNGITMNVSRTVTGTLTINSASEITGSNVLTSSGTMLLAAALDVKTAGGLVINGTFQINSGNLNSNSPVYGSSSTLIYNADYGPYLEWTGNSTTAGTGVPQNVTIQSGKTLSMPTTNRGIPGNITINGTLTLNSSSGDLYIGGNWERASGATFTHNNRAVFFNGQKVQTINAVSGQAANFAYLFVGTSSGTATTVQLGANVNVGTDGQGGTIFSFGNSNDVLDINGKTLTIGKTDASNTISVTGSFKGSSTSNLEIRGKDGIPTIKFASGGQELNNFKFYRLVAEGYSLGSDLKINGALTIDRGSLYLGNYNLTLGASATVSIPGSPTWGMLITDGTGKVSKIFTAAGSFSFPLGDNTGTREFSPLTITLTGGTYNSSTMVSAAVKNVVQTFTTNISTAYIKRYWTTSTTVTGYTSVDATFTYPVADVTGTESNIKLGGWDATAGGWVVGDLTDEPTHTLSLSTATLLDAYTGGNAFSPLISQATDYFRTKTGAGTLWNDKANWESSTDGITWQQSTLSPNTTAANILIKDAMTLNIGRTLNSLTIGNGGTLTLGANLTVAANKTLVINKGGILNHAYSYTLNINNGATFTVNDSGIYIITGRMPDFTGTGSMIVNSGGIVRADNNNSPNESDDIAFAATTQVAFETGSIFEWNMTSGYLNNDAVYFSNGSDIPIFRVSKTITGLSSSKPLIINGILDIRADNTYGGGGAKTFRNGITGNAKLTYTGGTLNINGTAPILGGKGLTINSTQNINLSSGITVPAGDSVIMIGSQSFAKGTNGVFTINGVLDLGTFNITNTSGSVDVNGTLKTSNVYGLRGSNTNISSTVGALNLNTGSTIEYNATLSQAITTSLNYYSIKFSGGTKTFNSSINVNTSGTVTISGNNVYIDATNNNLGPGTGSNSINFNMDGGTLILGTSGAQPNMDGTYNITGGKIIFNRASGLTIRPKIYNQIEIANSTSTSSGGGYLQLIANGSLTVKSGATYEQTSYSIKGVDATGGQKVIVEDGGTFITKSVNGFYGKNGTGSNYSAIHTNIVASNILLAPNSTVNFSATDNQTTTTGGITYGNVTLSGSGQKFFEGVVSIKGNLTAGTDMVLNSTTKGNLVYNGSGDQTVSGAGNLYLHTLEIDKGGGNLYINRNINQIDNWLTFTQGTLTLGSGVEINMTGGANISANGGDFNSGSLGKIVFKGNSTISGTGSIHFYPAVYLSPTGIGGVDFGTNNSTIQNLLQLDSGSYVSNHAPSYASGSTLKYNISGAYDRGIEWGTASGAGYPHHVQLTNNVIFNPARGDGSSQNTALNIGGDLTIDAGSELRMDYGVGSVTGMLQPLVVGGNLNINGKLSASIQNGGDIKLKGNWTRDSSGIFEGNDRAVFFIGSGNSDLQVNTTDRTETFPYLIVDKDTSSNELNLLDSVKVLKTFTFTKGTLDLKNADFTFVSNATATASITALNGTDQVISYSGVGRFVVERYLQNHKAWQFLSVPTVGSTFKTAWQENNTPLGNIKPGYGTMLTGTSGTTGYDYTSPQPSLKTFNSATQKYVEVPNTNDSMTSTSGYMVFVRGDRSIAPTSPSFSSTTLRTRGKIYDPSNVPAPITVPANKYALIGNRYPAPITFNSLTTTNIKPSYYLWDPNLAGNYGNGAFQTISSGVVSPGGGGYDFWDGNIQSGQAFFVLADSTDGTIEIPETAKQTGGVGSVFATGQSSNYFPPDATSYLRTNLYRINGTDAILLDGVISLFHVEYNPLIDMWDAEKLTNPNSENMGIRSLGHVLSIERTTSRSDVDSIFYKMNNYKIAPYRFVMEGYNLEVEGYDAFLWDKFLNTYTQVNPNGKVNYDFDVKGTPTGSWDENRFTIVFRSNGTVPVTLTNVKAYTQNKDINVEWTAATESNMKSYTVEVSADGNTFTAGGTLTAKNVDGTVYQWLHKDPGAGIHYYRIKSTGLDGKVTYSKIVNATISGTPTSLVSIYPNPIKDGVMNVQFDQQAAGTYQVRVLNTAGQLLLNTTLTHGGGSASQQVRMPATAVKGVYHVEVWKGDLRVMSEKVVY